MEGVPPHLDPSAIEGTMHASHGVRAALTCTSGR